MVFIQYTLKGLKTYFDSIFGKLILYKFQKNIKNKNISIKYRRLKFTHLDYKTKGRVNHHT